MATVVRPVIGNEAAKLNFWAAATWLSPPLALIATWAFSSYFNVLNWYSMLGDHVTPLQAFVIGLYTMSPFAACLYAVSEWSAARARSTKSWPAARGIVKSSEVADRYVHKRGRVYRLDIDYRYKVDGVEYESNRIQFGSTWLDDDDFVDKLAKKYPAGADVAVHYDPNKPESAVLDTSDEVAAAYASDYKSRAYVLLGTISGFPISAFLYDVFHRNTWAY
jgi:hypothetical protein